MCGAVACEELPAASLFGHAQLLMQRAHRLFRRTQSCVVSHRLSVTSSTVLMGGLPYASRRTRMVPSIWGMRRDDYSWQGDIDPAFSTLLKGCSIMGGALVHAPLPGWAALSPGAMGHLLGSCSELYLADYWLLTLHHLIWAKRLPYPIRANWFCGQSVHDSPFSFCSELPTHVAEASLEALILFREAAITPPRGLAVATVGNIEPPTLWEGHVSKIDAVAPSHEPMQPSMEAPVTAEPAAQPSSTPQPKDQQQSSALLELDDQTFTVSCGGGSYRFTARNKQLFALLDRIRRRPGYRVAFDELRAIGDVWDGSQVEDSTIGGAITRLRKLLKAEGMAPLAARLGTGTYQGRRYVILQVADHASE